MDKDFQIFYLDMVKILGLEDKSIEFREKAIDRVHKFRLQIANALNDAYNRGLLEGGYAMNQIQSEARKNM